jgi:hypothetical protein
VQDTAPVAAEARDVSVRDRLPKQITRRTPSRVIAPPAASGDASAETAGGARDSESARLRNRDRRAAALTPCRAPAVQGVDARTRPIPGTDREQPSKGGESSETGISVRCR